MDTPADVAIPSAAVPERRESWRTRSFRWMWNLFPSWRGAGGRVTFISADWRKIRVALPLSWRTRNYVGTIYGGSLYGALDPVYMIMLMKVLGPEYVVWDKSASIRFRKPGRGTLHATFVLDDALLDGIRDELRGQPSTERTFTVEWKDREGAVYASAEKLLWIGRKDARGKRQVSSEAGGAASGASG